MSDKSGCGFGYFFHKSGFPDERSLGERKTEADKPAGRQAKRFELEGNPIQLPRPEDIKHKISNFDKYIKAYLVMPKIYTFVKLERIFQLIHILD